MNGLENVSLFRDCRVTPDAFQEYPAHLKLNKTPLVIDNGSYQCRVGWAGDPKPRMIFKNHIGRQRGKKESDVYIGNDLTTLDTSKWLMRSPFDRNVLTQMDVQESLLDHVFERLSIDSEAINHPVVITEPPMNPIAARQNLSQLLFECYHVPGVCYAVDAMCSYHYNNQKPNSSGLVISIGHHSAHVLPVLNGKFEFTKAARLNIGGYQMAHFMQKLLHLKYPGHANNLSIYRSEECILDHSYQAMDYATELAMWENVPYYEKNVSKKQLGFSPIPALGISANTQKEKREKENKERRVLEAKRRHKKLAALYMKLDEALIKYVAEHKEIAEKPVESVEEKRPELLPAERPTDSEVKPDETLEKSEPKVVMDTENYETKLRTNDENPDKNLENSETKPDTDTESSELKPADTDKSDTNSQTEDSEKKQETDIEKSEMKLEAIAEVKVVAIDDSEIRDICLSIHKMQDRIDSKFLVKGALSEPIPENETEEIREKREEYLKNLEEKFTILNEEKRKQKEAERDALDQERDEDFDSWLVKVKHKRRSCIGSRDERRKVAQKRSEWNMIDDQQLSDSETESDLESEVQYLDGLLKEHAPDVEREVGFIEPAGDLAEFYRVHIAVEKIRCPELLYQPSMMGYDQAGLTETIENVLKKFTLEQQLEMVQYVHLTGSTCRLPNLKERLEAEMISILPYQTKLNMFLAGDVSLDAWHGANKLATSASFDEFMITKAKYEEMGADYIQEHFCSNPYFAMPSSIE